MYQVHVTDMSINTSNLIVVFYAGFCIDRTSFFCIDFKEVISDGHKSSVEHTTYNSTWIPLRHFSFKSYSVIS